MERSLSRRVVVHLGGYHPVPPADVYARAQRDFSRFCSLWSVTGAMSPPEFQENWTAWRAQVQGPGWVADSDYRFFRWDDVMQRERQRSWLARLPLGLWALVDFCLGGAPVGYLRHGWRYLFFFLYPIVVLALIGLLSGGIGYAASSLFRFEGHGAVTVLALILFAVLLPLIGNRVYLDHMLDDWIHARDLVRRPDPIVDQRLEALANDLTRHVGTEILILGHSLGAVLGADLITRYLGKTAPGVRVRFASVGSSILKIGLHRRAQWLKSDVAVMARSGRVFWVDFQALNDVMNFYKSEPVSALGSDAPPALSRLVRFRAMVHPDRYKRMERNFFRLHNQFVHANDIRARYDVQMMTYGPFALEHLTAYEDGPLSLLDETGALTDAGVAACSRTV